MITHNDLSISEGPVTHFTEIAANLQKRGLKITAFAPNLTGLKKQWDFHVEYLPCCTRAKGFSQLVYEFFLLIFLFLKSVKEKPDIIYSRQSYITFAAPLVAIICNIPLITEVNGVFTDDLNGRNVSIIRKSINSFCERFAYIKSKKIIGVSNIVCDTIQKLYNQPPEKLVPLPNGVNVQHFRRQDDSVRNKTRNKLNIAPSDFCIGYVGCFTPFDGIEILPEIALLLQMENVNDVKFLLIGEEKKKNNIMDLINKYKVREFFILTGRIDYKLLPEYLSAFDIGIAPYRYAKRESDKRYIGNSSLKCLEYSAAGLPVITTFLPQSEYILETRSGILVEPENIGGILKAIKDYKARSKIELQNEGDRGAEYVRVNRSWASVANKTIDIIKDVIRKYQNPVSSPIIK